MAVKVLRGVSVSPRGNRFQSQNWPRSYAFGGWIYSTNGSINFGEAPSEITLSIALGNIGDDDTSDFSTQPQTFDINKNDLKLGTDANGQEGLFDIDINGAEFKDYVLYSYDIDVQANQKVLNVVLKDYSVILDKIYVGLIKRQGAKYIHRTNISGIFPIKCPDCQYSGDAFTHDGVLAREVDLGSYAGMNGQTYNNMADAEAVLNQNTALQRNVYDYWTELSTLAQNSSNRSTSWEDNFNLNGGYLILGTEDIPQDACGGLPEVKYSFPELLWSLKHRGLNFAGAFPSGYSTRSLYFKQNYVGTLREVLNNWGSDFGINFFASGKTFWGMDITNPIELGALTGIVDPNDSRGAVFDFTEEDAVASYKESYSLDNTYDQSVITYSIKPAQSDTRSKEVKRHVGYAPLHPMDLNYVSRNSLTLFNNAFGKAFITNTPFFDFESCHNDPLTTIVSCGPTTPILASLNHAGDRAKRFDKWTNRTFAEMDISMALSKYNSTLRNIYVGSRIVDSLKTMDPTREGIYGQQNATASAAAKIDFDANFKAMGFHPIARILDPRIKYPILTKHKGGKGGGGNSNDQQFFEIYLGYHFPEELAAVTQTEKTMAEDMYKYGQLTQGIVNNAPYTVEDYFYNLSPDAGLTYGSSGIKRTTYRHDYEPETKQHPVIEDAPFKDSVPFYNWSNSDRYTGAFYGQLENLWGTTQEDFDRSIEFDDDECQQYSAVASANEKLNDTTATTKQTWDMNYFAPSFHNDVEFYENAGFRAMINSLAANNQLGVDQVSVGFWNYDGEYELGCRKLHICIIPITRGGIRDTYSCHPNGRFGFDPSCDNRTMNQEMFMKYQQEIENEEKGKAKEEIPSICDVSVEQELCKNALQTSGDAVRASSYGCDLLMDEALQKFDCVVDPTGVYRVGFHPSWIQQPNSRYLSVNIERNPAGLTDGTFIPSDENGNVYIRDIATRETLEPYNYRHINSIITYPVSTPYDQDGSTYGNYDQAGRLYYGTMTTTVNTEIRTPESVEIYGEPVNKLNSSASSFKIINNEVDPNLDPFLNSDTNQFLSYMSIITGNNPSSVASIREYHDIINGLNAYNSPTASEKIDLEIIGEPTGIADIITPLSGLTAFSVVIGQAGIKTSLSFSSKPPTLPEQESILNKISARLPKR